MTAPIAASHASTLRASHRRSATCAARPMHASGRPIVGQETWPPWPGQRRERRWREGVAQDQEVCQPRRRPTGPRGRGSVRQTLRDRGRGVACSEDGRDPERLVVLGRRARRPRIVDPSLIDAGTLGGPRERLDARCVQLGESRDEGPDRVAVRAVARLADGGIPAARQPLAGPLPERLAQQLVEERAEHELRPVRLDGVAHAGAGGGRWIEPRIDGLLHRVERGRLLRGQEPGDRRAEGDRCRLRAREPVDLVGLERGDAVQEPGQGLGRIDGPRMDVPRRASLRDADRGRRCRGRTGGRHVRGRSAPGGRGRRASRGRR